MNGGPGVGRRPGQHLVADRREGELVGHGAGPLGHRLLGGHVHRRADVVALFGQVLARMLVQVERDAEVGEHRHAVLGEQDVLGLDVAVHDARAVGVRQRLGGLAGDPEGVVHRQALLPLEAGTERLAADVGHGEPELPVVLARVVDRADVGVLQPRRRRDLAAEALDVHAGADLGPEQLEGDGPVVAQVVGEVDGRHSAPAELALEAVASLQGGGRGGSGHGLVRVTMLKGAEVGAPAPAGTQQGHGQGTHAPQCSATTCGDAR